MKRRILIADIRLHVANVFGVTPAGIASRSRWSNLVRPRQVVCYLARTMTGLSFPVIGARMGRDHSTVIHGYHKCIDMMRRDPVFHAMVRQARKRARRFAPFAEMRAKADMLERRVSELEAREAWAALALSLEAVEPRKPPKPRTEWWELSDIELLDRAVQAHKAKGGDFLEVWG